MSNLWMIEKKNVCINWESHPACLTNGCCRSTELCIRCTDILNVKCLDWLNHAVYAAFIPPYRIKIRICASVRLRCIHTRAHTHEKYSHCCVPCGLFIHVFFFLFVVTKLEFCFIYLRRLFAGCKLYFMWKILILLWSKVVHLHLNLALFIYFFRSILE